MARKSECNCGSGGRSPTLKIVELSNCSIDFAWLPKRTAFHAAGDDKRLASDMARQRVGREKNGGVGNIIGAGDLRKGHGGGNFFDDGGVAEFSFVSRHDGPARADAIEASTAIVPSVGSDSGDFVFQ